jgi:hypothetical protein
MQAKAETEQLFKELAYRESDGVEVSLVWNVVERSVSVLVVDTKEADVFELPVASDDALDVFHHPYAYAASRGLDFRAPALAASGSRSR